MSPEDVKQTEYNNKATTTVEPNIYKTKITSSTTTRENTYNHRENRCGRYLEASKRNDGRIKPHILSYTQFSNGEFSIKAYPPKPTKQAEVEPEQLTTSDVRAVNEGHFDRGSKRDPKFSKCDFGDPVLRASPGFAVDTVIYGSFQTLVTRF